MSSEEYRDVYIFAEQVDGKVNNIAYELIGEAKNPAEALETDVTVVLIGFGIKDEVEKLGTYGTDHVILVNDPALKECRTEPHTHVLAEVINKYKSEIVLIDATPIGRDLGPSASTRVATGLMVDCTKPKIGDFPSTVPAGKRDTQKHNQLLMMRPIFGDSTIVTTACPNNRPQMATVCLGVMWKRAKEGGRKFKLVGFSPDFTPNGRYVEILEVMKKISDTVDITSVKILVFGDRDVGSAENFKTLNGLAEVLGGEVSCSRVVVDAGWKSQAPQVGQTGKTVRPRLYFVIGVFGATQHPAGMEDPDLIIAINRDEDVLVFDVADIGIVGDPNQTVPTLMKQITNYLATKKQ